MICKFCNAAMDDDMTVCPVCGKDVTEETAAEEVTAAEETAEEAAEGECTCECQAETEAECTCEGECTCECQAEEAKTEEAPKKKCCGKAILGWVIAIILVAAIAAAGVFVWKQSELASQPIEDVMLSGKITDATGESGATGESEAALSDNATDATTESGTTGESEAALSSNATGYTIENDAMTADILNTVVASSEKMTLMRQMKETLGIKNKMTDGLTNAELAVYYWDSFYNFYNSYGLYAMMMGLDPLTMDTTIGMNENQTWQEYFLSQALNLYRSQIAICETAKQEGYTLSADMQDTLNTELEALGAMEDLEQQLESMYGPGVTKETYFAYIENLYLYSGYLTDKEASITYTDEDLSAHYDENAEAYQAQGILKDVEAVDSKAEAERIYAEWQAGEATEESFAALATANTTDPGSVETGGLYENVFVGQMVPTFNDWCFDESRQPGDTGIVETDYGHHVMYFVGRNDDETINVRHILLQSTDPNAWKETVAADYVAHAVSEYMTTVSQGYTLDYDASKIALVVPETVTAQG